MSKDQYGLLVCDACDFPIASNEPYVVHPATWELPVRHRHLRCWTRMAQAQRQNMED